MKPEAKPKSMIVAGVMSGTSADGVDVALVRISPPKEPSGTPRLKLLAHEQFPYEAGVRDAVLHAMDGKPTAPADLARLHWRLGQIYAESVAETARRHGIQPTLVGCHGQTIYHQAAAEEFCGASVRATWQLGEASAISELLRIPVVSDLRPADLAAGGQGAPLVPMLDYALFRSATRNRILLNLGGIANVTAIPAGGDRSSVLAFDTGPANMVVDALMQRLYGRAYDCGGQTAARGVELPIDYTDPYFLLPPPKSCGREQFGSAFVDEFHAKCLAAKLLHGEVHKADILTSATMLTARSTADAIQAFCIPHFAAHSTDSRKTEVVAAGGGTQNAFLIKMLHGLLSYQGIKLKKIDEIGIPSEAKEAVAFALLAWLTWHRLPGNIPSATGASREAVLGKITYA